MSTGAATVTGMLVCLALVVGVWWLMLRGWRARTARQEPLLPAPHEVPDTAPDAEPDAADVDGTAVEGVYVSTALAGRQLERVTAHGLGTRSRVVVAVRGGAVVLDRPGARSFAVPASDLVGVRRTQGQVGKYTFEKEGLVVITWRLGDVELDTAVRTRRRADAAVLAAAVQELVGAAAPARALPAGGTETAGGAA